MGGGMHCNDSWRVDRSGVGTISPRTTRRRQNNKRRTIPSLHTATATAVEGTCRPAPSSLTSRNTLRPLLDDDGSCCRRPVARLLIDSYSPTNSKDVFVALRSLPFFSAFYYSSCAHRLSHRPSRLHLPTHPRLHLPAAPTRRPPPPPLHHGLPRR